MKDNYNYPKTLRSYNELPSYNKDQKIRTLQQQSHNINQNCMLSNSKQVAKKVKQKKQKKATDLNSAIKKKLTQSKSTYQIVMTQNYDHCKSLQKLQLISNDRGHQLKKRIQQNGRLTAQNQQLRTKLSNPTFRQADLVQKICKYEFEIRQLKDMLKKKDQQLTLQRQQNKQAILQICKLHKQEIIRIKQQYSKGINYNRQSTAEKINAKKETTNPIQVFRTYQNQKREAGIVSDAKIYGSQTKNSNLIKYVNSNQPIHQTIGIQSQSIRNRSQNIGNQNPNMTSYIGEDGYERRIVRPNNQQKVKFTNPMVYNNINKASNEPRIFKASQQQQNIQLRSVMDKEWGKTTANYNPHQSYSSSLTYQCFNDSKK